MNAEIIARIHIANPEAIAGVDDMGVARQMVRDLAHSLSLFEDEDGAAQLARLQAAIAMVRDLTPGDTMEAQLIVQIVSSHNIAAAAMRRANSPGTNPQAQEAALKIAARFMTLFREQMRALTHYRGTPDDRTRKCHRYGYDDKLWPENRHLARAAEDNEDEDEEEDDKKAGDGGEIRVNVEIGQCTPENEAEVRAIIAAAVSDAVGRHRAGQPPPNTT